MTETESKVIAAALRAHGLAEEQVRRTLDSLTGDPAEVACRALVARVVELCASGVSAEVKLSDDGGHWVRVLVTGAGTICHWPRRPGDESSWHLDAGTYAPDVAPSLMARAQRLQDLYRQLVAP